MTGSASKTELKPIYRFFNFERAPIVAGMLPLMPTNTRNTQFNAIRQVLDSWCECMHTEALQVECDEVAEFANVSGERAQQHILAAEVLIHT